MTQEIMQAMVSGGGYVALGLAGLGSAWGCGAAAMAAAGAWKKIYMQNKPAPFQLLVFSGLPLSQTIYGVVLFMMIHMRAAECYAFWPVFVFLGLFAGNALCASALYQGKAAAAACDAFAEPARDLPIILWFWGLLKRLRCSRWHSQLSHCRLLLRKQLLKRLKL